MGEFVFTKAIAYSLLQKTWFSSQTTILLNSLSHFFAVFSSCYFQSSEAVARRHSARKSVLRNFAKFTGKHLYQSPFLIKLQAWPATLLKKRLWHKCFPVNLTKFLRTPFLQNNSGRLLLNLTQNEFLTFFDSFWSFFVIDFDYVKGDWNITI